MRERHEPVRERSACHRGRLPAVLVGVLLLTACRPDGDGGSATTPVAGVAEAADITAHVPTWDQVGGRSFVLVSAEGPTLRRPLLGAEPFLRFPGSSEVVVATGCTDPRGEAGVVDGRLVVGEMNGTTADCGASTATSEDDLVRFLGSDPQILLEADELTLTADDGSVAVFRILGRPRERRLDRQLDELASNESDRIALHASAWRPDGRWEELPEGLAPLRLYTRDGELLVMGGCNVLSGSFELDGEAMHVDRLDTTSAQCDSAVTAAESRLRSFLEQGPTVELWSDRVSLSTPDLRITFVLVAR